MRVKLILCLTLFQLFLCAGQLKHKSKPVLLEVGSFKTQQNGETLSFEGHIRNVGDVSVGRVTLTFVLLGDGGKELSRHSGALDQEELAPGMEAAFAFEMPWNPDAVAVQIEAKGPHKVEIQLSGAGPHRIE